MVVIMLHHGTAAIMPELRCQLQVPTELFNATPGAPVLLRKMDLPAASVLLAEFMRRSSSAYYSSDMKIFMLSSVILCYDKIKLLQWSRVYKIISVNYY